MPVNFKFYRISERKPSHGESVIFLKERTNSFQPMETVVEYVWDEIDPITNQLTGNGCCYSEDDNVSDFINHRLMILLDGCYAQPDDLWCPIDEYWDSFDSSSNEPSNGHPLTIESLVKEVKESLFNKICFRFDGAVARCVGAAEDEDDFYYIMRNLGGELVYDSAVITPIPIDDSKHYDLIEQHFDRNDCGSQHILIIDDIN